MRFPLIYFLFKECKSKELSPNIMMLSKDKDNAVAEGKWEKLLFVVLLHEKHNDCTGRSAFSPVFSFRWKTYTCFITNTHTRLALQSTFTAQVYIKTLLGFAVNFFHMISFSLFLSFHRSACRVNENRGGTRWLNCSVFMLSSCVNMEPSSVNWIPQLVTESLHGDVGYHWDTTQSHTCSCHIFPAIQTENTAPLNSPTQEQDLIKAEQKNPPFGIAVFLSTCWLNSSFYGMWVMVVHHYKLCCLFAGSRGFSCYRQVQI